LGYKLQGKSLTVFIQQECADEDIWGVLGLLTVAGGIYKMRSFLICTAAQKLFGL